MKIITRTDARAANLKRYFTGEICRYGHCAERRVSDYGCIECSRLKSASPAERERRRDYMIAHQRRYRKLHPDRIKGYRLKQDKAQLAAYRRELRAKDPEKHKASLRKSFQKHKAKRMAEARAWRIENRERSSMHMRAAKAKRRAAEGRYSANDIRQLLEIQNNTCLACHVNISSNYHVDHIIPLARGGTNWPDNLQLLCQICNQSKGAKTMQEWADWKAVMASFSLSFSG